MQPTLCHVRLRLVLLAAFVLCLAALAQPASAHADGIFIPVPGYYIDGVFGADNRLVYLTGGSQILRYDLVSQSFLPPFELGGDLLGIDLSPDGKVLAVADRSYTDGESWIYLVNADTGAAQKVAFAREILEGGTYTVAYGADGRLLVSSGPRYSGGAVPLRRYDPETGATVTLQTMAENTMLSASADRSVIAYANYWQWGWYRVASGALTEACELCGFTWEIATNRDASQTAVPTFGGTFIYNASASKIATLGQYAGEQPVGVAYHPTRELLYAAWAEKPEIRVFDTTTFNQVDSFAMGASFRWSDNASFIQGRLKIARDGSLLLATFEDGVRVVRTESPQTQISIQADPNPVVAGQPITITATVQRKAPATGAPAGYVTFGESPNGGFPRGLGTSPLDIEGHAVLTTTLLGGGHVVTASYVGGLYDRTSGSEPLVVDATPAPTSADLELGTLQAEYGANVFVTATVRTLAPGSLGRVTGGVNILDGSQAAWSGWLDTLGRARVTVGWLEVGAHCLAARYVGDGNYAASTSAASCLQVIRRNTIVDVTGAGRRTDGGMNATFSVKVRVAPQGFIYPSGRLGLMIDEALLGTYPLDRYGMATFSVDGLSNESHAFRVEYLGDGHFNPSAATIAVGPVVPAYLPGLMR